MKKRALLAGLTIGLMMVLPRLGVSQRSSSHAFVSRSGWRVRYPSAWKLGSCRSCSDPKASGVFVDFIPPAVGRAADLVMVEVLQKKPSTLDLDAWLGQVSKTANQNPIKSEQRFQLNGRTAMRVRYLHGGADESEMESVYVVAGSRTFSLSFTTEKPGVPIERSANYPQFLKIVDSFQTEDR
jgi:hypothetical protein